MTNSRFSRLNAPYGARCFLTHNSRARDGSLGGLNAPYGARCFLTRGIRRAHSGEHVLMHLMVRGAF